MKHKSVLLEESINGLNIKDLILIFSLAKMAFDKVFIDITPMMSSIVSS